MVVDLLADRMGGRWRAHKSRADVVEGRLSGTPVVLAKPRSYMNDSGGAVASVRDYYDVPLERVVIVHDELDLPFETLRLKAGGGDNGHNGLRSLRRSLGSGEFLRLRVGIGRPPGRMDPADFVLKPFTGAERRELPLVVDRAGDAVELLVRDGLAATQNRVHADPP